MFPEIFRDEVFRLETRRLWLRWPMLGDAAAAVADATDRMHTCLTSANIATWRLANSQGAALHLLLVTKPDHVPVGTLHLAPDGPASLALDAWLSPDLRRQGLMTEAIQAAARAAFMLAEPRSINAAPAADNREGRGVLEHCGFTYAGSGMRPSRSGRGLVPCDHFRLDHPTWSSLQGWAMPGFAAYVGNGLPAQGREGCPLTL